MRFDQTFTIPVGADEAYRAITDVPLMASCLAGVELQGQEGDRHLGTLKARLGPISLTYAGSAWFEEADPAAKRFRVVATGTEAGGSGTAGATVTGRLEASGDATTDVHLDIDLQIAGRPAQFGRGLIVDVSKQLTDDFATRLAAELTDGAVGDERRERQETDVALNAWSLVPAKVKLVGAVLVGFVTGALVGVAAVRNRASRGTGKRD